jgi:hypothetical protein
VIGLGDRVRDGVTVRMGGREARKLSHVTGLDWNYRHLEGRVVIGLGDRVKG